eukprot:CAMPEP_0116019114 /NCGR_PEP_ID=MMETSP0321-20121206/9039_1 /TAXON_ID=163516 /ORGANISM="Leptocylindrus danicus var. danicus, Strain B650" /LENGTH=303 /DNA_ID=CAMNT_0003489613 /DNA_START=34 /DNA_END=945 /DNA_ORIENTATION=-
MGNAITTNTTESCTEQYSENDIKNNQNGHCHANNENTNYCPTITTNTPIQHQSTSPLGEIAPTVIRKPKRIILVRHEQSLGNIDELQYTKIPDWKIPITDAGRKHGAEVTAKNIRDLIDNKPVMFYTSPYKRTMETCQIIMDACKEDERNQVLGMREEPRMVEQQFGNFQNGEVMKKAKTERWKYGSFFYRFPNGESGLDVYNRAATFINTLFRDFCNPNINFDDDYNVVIVTHGLTLRLFLMRWFQFSVEDFENTVNPENGGTVVMNRMCEYDDVSQSTKAWFEVDVESRRKLKLPEHRQHI